jgi:hypothetical protein
MRRIAAVRRYDLLDTPLDGPEVAMHREPM